MIGTTDAIENKIEGETRSQTYRTGFFRIVSKKEIFIIINGYQVVAEGVNIVEIIQLQRGEYVISTEEKGFCGRRKGLDFFVKKVTKVTVIICTKF